MPRKSAQAGLFPERSAKLPAGLLHRPGLLDPAGQQGLLAAVREVARAAPFAHARTKMGLTSAAMTNAGDAGWWSDLKGYRYETRNPATGKSWPPMPEVFREVVARAVADTPWPDFTPDACLINFYGEGAKMGLHQDRDEKDFAQPIVTVSLGDDGDFQIGGMTRSDRGQVLVVKSGDALIMGGDSRMRFHGIRKIHFGTSPLETLAGRISLTFRKAL
jgi:alkylated DNA repair protein (DNA oxidative demethylase)